MNSTPPRTTNSFRMVYPAALHAFATPGATVSPFALVPENVHSTLQVGCFTYQRALEPPASKGGVELVRESPEKIQCPSLHGLWASQPVDTAVESLVAELSTGPNPMASSSCLGELLEQIDRILPPLLLDAPSMGVASRRPTRCALSYELRELSALPSLSLPERSVEWGGTPVTARALDPIENLSSNGSSLQLLSDLSVHAVGEETTHEKSLLAQQAPRKTRNKNRSKEKWMRSVLRPLRQDKRRVQWVTANLGDTLPQWQPGQDRRQVQGKRRRMIEKELFRTKDIFHTSAERDNFCAPDGSEAATISYSRWRTEMVHTLRQDYAHVASVNERLESRLPKFENGMNAKTRNRVRYLRTKMVDEALLEPFSGTPYRQGGLLAPKAKSAAES